MSTTINPTKRPDFAALTVGDIDTLRAALRVLHATREQRLRQSGSPISSGISQTAWNELLMDKKNAADLYGRMFKETLE